MDGKLYIGPAGWSYPDWKGTLYPLKRDGPFDPLRYLSGYFDLIEVNSTFYRIPSPHRTLSWVQRTAENRDFLFTVKAPQQFTHSEDPIGPAETSAFLEAMEPLEKAGKLGFVLLQFPWSFRFGPAARKRICEAVRALSPLPLALEVRHGSWAVPEALDFAGEMELAMCGIDQPQVGESLSLSTFLPSAGGAYFRLHGRNAAEWFRPGTNRDLRYDYLYSRDELEGWSRRIRETIERVQRVFVVLNNHFRAQAPANALELKAMVLGRAVPVPRTIMRTYPRLREIALSMEKGAGKKEEPVQRSLFDEEDEDHDE